MECYEPGRHNGLGEMERDTYCERKRDGDFVIVYDVIQRPPAHKLCDDAQIKRFQAHSHKQQNI